jgi:hypothetical protein
MSDYKDRARRYHHAIREILLRDWDPIEVGAVAQAQDEYDSYIPGIYGRLIHRISEQELFDHLWQIETEHMGLFGNRGKTQQVAQKLLLLNTQLESTPTT